MSKNIYITVIYFNSYFLLTVSRKKEILNATKQNFGAYNVVHRIQASLIVEEIMITCDFLVEDKGVGDTFDVNVNCDNDKVMQLLIKKIGS